MFLFLYLSQPKDMYLHAFSFHYSFKHKTNYLSWTLNTFNTAVLNKYEAAKTVM